eukprot:1584311-Prymnesium_polylepis.1
MARPRAREARRRLERTAIVGAVGAPRGRGGAVRLRLHAGQLVVRRAFDGRRRARGRGRGLRLLLLLREEGRLFRLERAQRLVVNVLLSRLCGEGQHARHARRRSDGGAASTAVQQAGVCRCRRPKARWRSHRNTAWEGVTRSRRQRRRHAHRPWPCPSRRPSHGRRAAACRRPPRRPRSAPRAPPPSSPSPRAPCA